jgi:hypothetical protein
VWGKNGAQGALYHHRFGAQAQMANRVGTGRCAISAGEPGWNGSVRDLSWRTGLETGRCAIGAGGPGGARSELADRVVRELSLRGCQFSRFLDLGVFYLILIYPGVR